MPTQQDIQYLQRFNNFVDGLALNTALVPSAYNYQLHCFDAMAAVRLANNYRPKLYGIPDQTVFGAGMVPFSDFMTQVRLVPGTIIVGMSLTVLNFDTNTSAAFELADNFYVGVEDDSTGIPFFSDWLAETTFNVPVLYTDPNVAAVNTYVAKTAWLPLTKPRPVGELGQITVKMSYKATPSTSGNISPQLVLICAEPCVTVTKTEECR